MTPSDYIARAGLSFRPPPQALADPQGRIVAHLRRPGAVDLACTADLRGEIALYETPQGEPPLFVSYYTTDTPYEGLAADLRASLDHHHLPHRIQPVASRGSWVANTGLKARVIQAAWQDSGRPVCWIDADAAILRPPAFLMGNPFDVAFVRRQGWEDISYLIYLNTSPAVGRLLAEWVRLCDEYPHVWDQVLFSLAWFRTARDTDLASQWLNSGISRTPRPWIRDLRDRILHYPSGRKIRPFIDQKQASRQLKAYVNASARHRDEIGTDDLSAGYRAALKGYDFSFDPRLEAVVARRA
ncbi:hypothetical protein PARHAE_00515 [Paracoccus haematequi]|uniref:Nucleotide-diphospho-sugar transferase n=1 Tax=Paracoccus haematequi TaxID=2491866 RepID=A0A3S4DU71_9RHOB|nr:hypothetical protein [Paracoccus haematequi]VDS07340.1 hypothetical protein PARHAE_00515 [Paracoccus haematequi]